MTTIRQLMDLRGRRALLTGALGGLGRVMSHALAELGADLVLVDRPGSDFSTLLAELDQWQIKALPLSCDIEQGPERCALMKNIKADGQSLSILLNNAAFVVTSGLTGRDVPSEQQNVAPCCSPWK